MSFPQSFISKKRTILAQLAIPVEDYDDLSPKGSIDVGIRELIDEINRSEGWVTTSSCAGRVSVFLEGQRKDIAVVESDENAESVEEDVSASRAGVGGKGGGGKWLFVSHDPVTLDGGRTGHLAGMLGMGIASDEKPLKQVLGDEILGRRFIHFKFEPMVCFLFPRYRCRNFTNLNQILHVLTASLSHAQTILSCALQAGFRESGAVNILPSGKEAATPIVAVRSQGTMLESLVGFLDDDKARCNVPEAYLETLLRISNERFSENEKRIQRFRDELRKADYGADAAKDKRKGDAGEWEDPAARRERKKAEGILKGQLSKKLDNDVLMGMKNDAGLDFLEQII